MFVLFLRVYRVTVSPDKISTSCRSSWVLFRSRQKRLWGSFWPHIWLMKIHFLSFLATFVTGKIGNVGGAVRLIIDIRGSRFSYTFYYPEPAPSSATPVRISRSTGPSPSHPIHQSIRRLDTEAIESLTIPPSNAQQAHQEFSTYLSQTKNTICGRHPIGVLLGALSALEKESGIDATLKFVRYEQSSACISARDSSVSYASAYIKF